MQFTNEVEMRFMPSGYYIDARPNQQMVAALFLIR